MNRGAWDKCRDMRGLSPRDQVEARLWDALRTVEDPEIPVSVVGMGLIVSLGYEAERKLRITRPCLATLRRFGRARLNSSIAPSPCVPASTPLHNCSHPDRETRSRRCEAFRPAVRTTRRFARR